MAQALPIPRLARTPGGPFMATIGDTPLVRLGTMAREFTIYDTFFTRNVICKNSMFCILTILNMNIDLLSLKIVLQNNDYY